MALFMGGALAVLLMEEGEVRLVVNPSEPSVLAPPRDRGHEELHVLGEGHRVTLPSQAWIAERDAEKARHPGLGLDVPGALSPARHISDEARAPRAEPFTVQRHRFDLAVPSMDWHRAT